MVGVWGRVKFILGQFNKTYPRIFFMPKINLPNKSTDFLKISIAIKVLLTLNQLLFPQILPSNYMQSTFPVAQTKNLGGILNSFITSTSTCSPSQHIQNPTTFFHFPSTTHIHGSIFSFSGLLQ